jgi:hypothetical protein
MDTHVDRLVLSGLALATLAHRCQSLTYFGAFLVSLLAIVCPQHADLDLSALDIVKYWGSRRDSMGTDRIH